MKHSIIMVFGILCGALVGVLFHGHVLSLFDGIVRLTPLPLETLPEASDLSQAQSKAISQVFAEKYVRLRLASFPNAEPVGELLVYEDAESFLFLPTTNLDWYMRCSYYAKRLGIRIRKSDGCYLHSVTGTWQPSGLINAGEDDARALLSELRTVTAIERRIGSPLKEEYYLLSGESTETGLVQFRKYLSRDGMISVCLINGFVPTNQLQDAYVDPLPSSLNSPDP